MLSTLRNSGFILEGLVSTGGGAVGQMCVLNGSSYLSGEERFKGMTLDDDERGQDELWASAHFPGDVEWDSLSDQLQRQALFC